MEKWEKEFDRIFVDENVWQGEDDYTKNVPIGNIKKFIESLLEERDTYCKEREKESKNKWIDWAFRYIETGMGFNKGSINDDMFQRLKQKALDTLLDNLK